MTRQTLIVKLVLLLVVLSTLAVVLGSEPWGPN
jgi:hypothetical protein